MKWFYGGDLIQLQEGHEYALYSRDDWGRRHCSAAPSSDLSHRESHTDSGIRDRPIRDGDGLYTADHEWREFRVFAPTASDRYSFECDTDLRVILADPQVAPDADRRARTQGINDLVQVMWTLGLWATLAGAVVLGCCGRRGRARGVGRNLMLWGMAGVVLATTLDFVVRQARGIESQERGLSVAWLTDRAEWVSVPSVLLFLAGMVCWIWGVIRGAWRRRRDTRGGSGPGGSARSHARLRLTPGRGEDGTMWV